MAKYSGSNIMGGTPQAIAATFKTLLYTAAASGTALRRQKLYDILMGTNGTPADNYLEYDLAQTTIAGTATGITPKPLDQADAAFLGIMQANATAEPTVTANSDVLYVGVNQRASYRWVAAPGSEIVIPATNVAGYAFRARSAGYTGTATGTWLVEEQ